MIFESQSITPDQMIYWVKKRNVLDAQMNLSEEDSIRARQEWIRSARKRFHPGERKPCYICKKYSSISHAHHLAPLVLQFTYRVIIPMQDFVWLCPTHHELVHAVLQSLISNNGSSLLDIANEIQDEELDCILTVARIGMKKLKDKK